MILTKVLPYTVEAFRSFYDDEFIASFTHKRLAKGQIDPAQTLKLVERLNAGVCLKIPCVSFNQEMLSGDQLDGGACSAIAFRVAKEALTLLKKMKENLLKPSNKTICFVLRFSEFVRNLEVIADSKRPQDKAVQCEIRTEQAAFNTIFVDRDRVRSGNAVSEKMGALALFYGLKVVESSPELRVKGNEHLAAQLLKQMRSVKEGVYILRVIQENQEKPNHKLEEKGHTAVYLKTVSEEYYFDPQLGSYALFSESAKPNLIYNALLSGNEKFGVDVLSFHRLEEQET
jgi:hypothetical protein